MMMIQKSPAEVRADEDRAAQINDYWRDRGIEANARVEEVTVPVYFRYEPIRVNGKLVDWDYVTLKVPDMVTIPTIVSDLTGRENPRRLSRTLNVTQYSRSVPA